MADSNPTFLINIFNVEVLLLDRCFIGVFGYFISDKLFLLLVALKILWLNEGLDVTELAKL